MNFCLGTLEFVIWISLWSANCKILCLTPNSTKSTRLLSCWAVSSLRTNNTGWDCDVGYRSSSGSQLFKCVVFSVNCSPTEPTTTANNGSWFYFCKFSVQFFFRSPVETGLIIPASYSRSVGKWIQELRLVLQSCATNRCVMISLHDSTKQYDNFQACELTQ